MATAGNELLAALRSAAVELLGDLSVPTVDTFLAALGPPPAAWTGHALDDQLVGRVTDVEAVQAAIPNQGAAAAIGRVLALVGDSDAIGVFGRQSGGRRTLTLAAQSGTGPDRLVVLLGPRADGAPGLEAVIAGSAAPITVAPVEGVRFTLTGQAPAGFTIAMPAEGPAAVTGNAPGASLRVDVELDPPIDPPAGDGPRLRRTSARFTMRVRAEDPAPTFDGSLELPGVTASLLPELLQSLVPDAVLPPIDVVVATDRLQGLVLQGDASLDVPLPGAGKLGPLTISRSAVTLGASAGAGGVQLRFGVRADVALDVPGAPLNLQIVGLGVEAGFDVTNPGPPTISVPPLTGIDAAVTLPIASGGGSLRQGDDGDWVGALALQLPPLAINAFAVFRAGPRPSFLAVLGIRFPPPGIQVGFGFAVSAVGGILGVDRRADLDALTIAVLDGSLAGLMFSDDPVRDARRVAGQLPRLFPAAPGRVLFGPMFEINWSGGLVRGQLALLLELPSPVRVILLGRLVVDLPHAALPIVHLDVQFMAAVDLDVPEFRVVAGLSGSHVVGLALTGDLFLLLRGGERGEMLLSAGGFHPAVRPPDGVPPLRRLGMVSTIAMMELRYEAYFALTPASVQFGARVELSASIADCGVHGWLGFDALFEWAPRFRFAASFSAGIEVEVFGETLLGVRLDGLLEGPTPWHVRARGEVEVLFVSVTLEVDETFGDDPRPLDIVPNVGAELAAELAKAPSWAMHPPPVDRDGVVLSALAGATVAAGGALHPAGSVTVRQRLLPFGFTIERFGGHAVPGQRWIVSGIGLRDGEPDHAPDELLVDQFPLGAFRTLSREEQLAGTAFSEQVSGARLSPTGVEHPAPRATELDWETIVLAPDLATNKVRSTRLTEGIGGHPELLHLDLAGARALAGTWPALDAPRVLPHPPLLVVPEVPVVGLVAGLASPPIASAGDALDLLRERRAAGQPARVLEQWELV